MYAGRCREALDELAREAARWPERPWLERDGAGPLPRVNVSVKISALTPLLRPDAPALGERDAAERLRPLLRRARELGAHVHIDMESLDSREAVLELVLRLLDEPEFADGPSAGIVIQAYLRDAPEQLDSVLGWAQATARRPPVQVRLVKGAYWDHELVEALQQGWPAPVFEVKADCDRNFEALTRTLLDARPVSGSRSPRTTCARLRTRSRTTACPGAPIPTSRSRSCGGSATSSRTRSRRTGSGSGPTARSATWSPGWRTWSAGSSRTRATSRFSTSRRAERRSSSCWRRHDRAARPRWRRSPTSPCSSCGVRPCAPGSRVPWRSSTPPCR